MSSFKLLSDQGLPYTSAAPLPVDIGGSKGYSTTNGLTNLKRISTADVNAAVVKASAGCVYGGLAVNTTAAWKYLKFFQKATIPVPGTDTPVIILGIPPNDKIELAAAFGPLGLYLVTGIGIAITGAAADLDTTALAVGDVILALTYV